MFLVGAGALEIPLLRERRLQQRVGLGQHDRAREPGPDLNRQDAHLLSIGADGLRQDLGLRVQQAQRVVVLRDICLNHQPHHRLIIGACRGLRTGGLEPPANAAPHVDLVGQIDRDQPVVERGAGSYRLACRWCSCDSRRCAARVNVGLAEIVGAR